MTILDVFHHNAWAFYGVVGVISLLVGSFLNVVIHRLPIMMERSWVQGIHEYQQQKASEQAQSSSDQGEEGAIQIVAQPSEILSESVNSLDQEASHEKVDEPFNLAVPRSRCPSCGAEITALQNIPVLSYLFLLGKCAGCKIKISARYPMVEFVTMMLSLVVAWQLGPTPQALLGIVVTWFLISMSMIDFDHQLLPDSLTLPLMWLGLIAALFPVFTDLRSAVIGAAAGYLILWSIYWAFKLMTGKEGMGFGDFKLLAALGALLGWQTLPVIILFSSVVGAAVGMILIAATGRDKSIPMPFGPYLAAAGWIAMLWGDTLSAWYYGLLS